VLLAAMQHCPSWAHSAFTLLSLAVIKSQAQCTATLELLARAQGLKHIAVVLRPYAVNGEAEDELGI